MESEDRLIKSESSDRKPEPSLARRAGQVGLAFINPFSDLAVIYRTGIQPLGFKMRLLREQFKTSEAPKEQLSWTQAVASSGRTVEQLLTAFRRKRMAWWVVMLGMGSFAFLLLLMMLYTSSSLPAQTLVRAVLTELTLVFVALLGWAKVVEANYRLWQLSTQRVSLDEHGTFQDYKAETDMWFQVMTFSAPY
ncbi:conjugal transfer protein TraX [Pseudomonas viridiflava]|uniref:conjugal transfer protein TraX n=1 Tax=Pseudomonas viridiflava TaxID=33069 RepID=UPI000F04D0BB|nr:conjugal transfer protein TraX [Pseudomonas viridiflava]